MRKHAGPCKFCGSVARRHGPQTCRAGMARELRCLFQLRHQRNAIARRLNELEAALRRIRDGATLSPKDEARIAIEKDEAQR